MASMVLQRSVVESLLGFTSIVAEHCGDLLDGQSVDLEVNFETMMVIFFMWFGPGSDRHK